MSQQHLEAASVRIPIKVCGFTRATDLSCAIDVGIDAVGLVLEPGTPHSLSKGAASRLLETLRESDVVSVAVVGRMPAAEVKEVARLGFDVVQWVTTPEQAGQVQEVCLLPVLFDGADLLDRATAWMPGLSTRKGKAAVPAWWPERGLVNVDSAKGGASGVPSDWHRAREVQMRVPNMLAGGLRADNVGHAIEVVRPFAVDVCSGVEAAPGVKSAEKMSAFVRAVTIAAGDTASKETI